MPLALLYHAVATLPAGFPAARRTLVVEPAELDWQLGELRRLGYRSLSLAGYEAALEAGELEERSVLLTFDDAYAHLFENVTPLLRAHGFSAVVFVPVGHIGEANTWDGPELVVHAEPIASAAALARAARGPWELGSHGVSHVDLRTLAHAERLRQLRSARERLAELAQAPVDALAYPYGHADEQVRADARAAGYRLGFVTRAPHSADRLSCPRTFVYGQETHTSFRIRIEPEFRQLFG